MDNHEYRGKESNTLSWQPKHGTLCHYNNHREDVRKCGEHDEATWPAQTNTRMRSQCHSLMEGND